MKRYLLIAVSVATLLILAIPNQPLKAQVYDEYGVTTVVNQTPYQELTSDKDNKNVIPASKFALPPNFIEGTAKGRDDGFYQVALPFEFEYNGELYNSVWICVNGYIMFTPAGQLPPQTLPSKNPTGVGATGFNYANWFYYYNASYPMNIIAPYMGDHFYRSGDDNPTPWPGANQYANSEISTGSTDLNGDDTIDVFTVQWKNLNINYDDPNDIIESKGITSSIASFQVKLYRSTDQYTKQGNIEFCYGQAGYVGTNPPQTTETNVVTTGCVVGLKGNSGQDGQFADFLNGLYNEHSWDSVYNTNMNYDQAIAMTDTVTTVAWQPSGGSDYRIVFTALGRHQLEEYWGDGDVNLSQVEGGKEAGLPQSRFVTVSDARDIISSIVNEKPLPRERRREAYHGDVNHNGRYFFYEDHTWFGWNGAGTNRNVYPKDTVFRVDMPWKNAYYGDSIGYILHDVWVPDDTTTPQDESHWIYNDVIPSQISSLAELYFQADEYDAALIMHYIGGRLTSLPYLLDSFPLYGKIIPNELYASGIRLGEIQGMGNSTYEVPIYLNGSLNGPLGLKAVLNGNITNVTTFKNGMIASYDKGNLAIAGSNEFDGNSPVCIVTIQTNNTVLNVSGIRFNDKDLPSLQRPMSVNSTTTSSIISQNIPNPFTDHTVFMVNLPESGNYSMRIYNSMGNEVKTINNVESGQVTWNGRDNAGSKVASGVYICKLTGDNNVNVSKSIVLTR